MSYQSVIEKERRGEYLGKTVQIIPHITDEIKRCIQILGNKEKFDFVITEIGGTVGDIESLPYVETVRQLMWEKEQDCIVIHLTLVPYLNAAGELKTKPTQHSVKMLLENGVQPDILVCRTEHPLGASVRSKIAKYRDWETKITDKGIGNGTSLIIMTGIISDIPRGFYSEFGAQTPFFFLIEMATLVVIIGATIGIIQAVRRIPVQMARLNAGSTTGLPAGEAARSFIPLRVNSAGVMPIIFAQAIMFIPLYLQNSETFRDSSVLASLTRIDGIGYNVLLFVMIILFTFFYTAIVTNPTQIADDLKRNGNFVPGVKPGKETSEFIDRVLSNITLPGGIFVALIAILPAILMMLGLAKTQQFAQFFGGTSLLITVGVILDLLQQIESHLLSRHYDGLMKSGRVRGRSNNAGAVGTGYTA